MASLSMSSRNSVYRAPAQCLGGHGFDSRRGLIFISLSHAHVMLIISSLSICLLLQNRLYIINCILVLLSGDFGIARMMENTFDMAQTCCGTPCYLSPELCQDMPYSSKADVWVRSLFTSSNNTDFHPKQLCNCGCTKQI